MPGVLAFTPGVLVLEQSMRFVSECILQDPPDNAWITAHLQQTIGKPTNSVRNIHARSDIHGSSDLEDRTGGQAKQQLQFARCAGFRQDVERDGGQLWTM